MKIIHGDICIIIDLNKINLGIRKENFPSVSNQRIDFKDGERFKLKTCLRDTKKSNPTQKVISLYIANDFF